MRANEVEKAEHFKGFDWCLSVRIYIRLYNMYCRTAISFPFILMSENQSLNDFYRG